MHLPTYTPVAFKGFYCPLVVTRVPCFFKFQKVWYPTFWSLNNIVTTLRHSCFFSLPFASSCQSYVIGVQVRKTHLFYHLYILIPDFVLFASFTFLFSYIKSSLLCLVPRTLHKSALINLFLEFPSPFLFLLAMRTLIECWNNLKVLRKGKDPRRISPQTTQHML